MFKNNYLKRCFLLFILMSFVQQPMAATTDDFVIEVNTSLNGISVNTEFEISTLGSGYNYNVDCDDDNAGTNTATAQTGNYTCSYASAGIYTIRIEDNAGDGTGFPGVFFNNSGDEDKILKLVQWGTGHWTSVTGAFYGANNMKVAATDVPDFSQVFIMASMFQDAVLANPDTTHWNTSNVVSMDSMFKGAVVAIPDTSNWDTTNVLNMNALFSEAILANPNTSGWNTKNVLSMSYMFSGTDSANPDTSGWDTANVADMSHMFHNADMANPDTSGWNTANVTDMSYMFSGTDTANPDTSGWDTDNVTDMSHMFSGTDIANPDTSSWDTANVTNMDYMFGFAALANPDTSGWDTANVTDMSDMFREAVVANPDTSGWDTANVTDMNYMFGFASLANPDTSGWNTANVTNMRLMFNVAVSANPDVTSWDITGISTMQDMFSGVTLPTTSYDAMLVHFNSQAVQSGVLFSGGNSKYCASGARDGLINTHSWTVTDGGFDSVCLSPTDGFVIQVDTTEIGTSNTRFKINTTGGGYNYNVDCDDDNPGTNTALGQTGDYICEYINPGVYTIRIEDNAGDGTGFPRIHFNNGGDKDKILDIIQWGTGKWTSMERAFHGAGNMIVSASDVPDISQVTSLSSMFNLAFKANPDTSSWNTSNVTNMRFMFHYATSADPDTSDWDTANVTDMGHMFASASVANPDTSGWDTANVTDMGHMFGAAIMANPDTSGWDTTNVTGMDFMFSNASVADPDTSSWNTENVTTMESMFRITVLANPDTSGWDTTQVIDMSSMFQFANSANPDTSSWDITGVETMEFMFDGVTLPTVSYDAILTHFNSQLVQSSIEFSGGDSKYCANDAHDNLIDSHGWIITDGGLDSSCDDIIFKNSFEVLVTTFNAHAKQFEYDFAILETVKLDGYPELIAIGVDSNQEKTIKIYVRKLGEHFQISMRERFHNAFEETQWSKHQWQNIVNTKLTIVSW